MRQKAADSDVLVSEIAGRRHGVIRTDQLRGAGLDGSAVRRRVQSGRLVARYRGVYSVGHGGLSVYGEWLAAVDACGAGAVLSHLAAACLWGFLDWRNSWPIDVTYPGSSHRASRDGIRIHRSVTLEPKDVTVRSEIPVTVPARIFRDLPPASRSALSRAAAREAEMMGFRSALPKGHVPNRSELELAFLALCRLHRLPTPQTRVMFGDYEVDFFFPEHNLIVETDGGAAHRGENAFEEDHERDLYLQLLGFRVIRFTWRQVTEQGPEVARALQILLDRGA